ncbi:MAG: hypothetical protein ILP16_10110, partial [Spirochaetales bacterium]|nr:hypothetical protein [Spirochaetales bacterium]
FVCWNTRADGSGASFNDCAQIEVPQKMTLYAQWGVLLTDDMEEWTESTYILNSDVTINYRVYIKNSDLRLILHDGYTLKADKGIFVSGGVILTIDADGEGTGCVDAEAEADSGYAAIGGNGTVPSGIIIINGGIIEADSDIGAGIGSGLGSEAVSVTINGGKVTARSDTGAGIGGGQSSAGCPVTINGGEVAASSTHGAGIGGGESGAGGQVAINGGEVAASSTQGAGIGGGESGAGGQVTINSGTVETSSVDGMGIGRGIYGSSDGTLEPGAGVRLYASDNGDNWIDYDSDETRRRFMRSEKP